MYRIGVDIGGTQLRAAAFDEDYTIVKRVQVPNDRSKSARENVDVITGFINAFSRSGNTCGGIGIGCPGPLDFSAGKVLNPPNLYGWNDFELVAYVEQSTGIKAVLNNDANCAGLAEARLGAGRGLASVFYITVSTGIGGAYVYKGELVNGARSSAAEVYNLIVCEDSFSHKGANAGSLNEVCGGDALARQGREVFGRPVDSKELYNELWLGEKNPQAVCIIERWFDNLAKGIANIACTVDPDMFIMGGSIALKSEGFFTTLIDRAKKYLIHPEALRIEKARLGEDAGLIGAALLAPDPARATPVRAIPTGAPASGAVPAGSIPEKS
jgi:glucokinase